MIIPFNCKEDYIILSFLLLWVYGIIRGAFLGNNTSYIVANFAGLICYITYFIFSTLKYRIKLLESILLICGITVSLIAAFRFIAFFLGINYSALSPILGEGMGISSTGQIRIYFSTQAISYVLLGLSYMVCLFPIKNKYINCFFKNRLFAFICFSLSISSLMFFSASKGFVLGVIIIISVMTFLYGLKPAFNGRISRGVLGLFILGIILIILLERLEYISIIDQMFDKNDESNSARYEQLTFMMKDMSFLGKGLGAEVIGSIRSFDAPYGFELTFINIIHKFGIFSLVLFYGWYYMIKQSLINIYKKKHLTESIIIFSSIGYFFPSIGNPMLFHPSLVILNSCAFYILREIRNEKSISMHGHL